MDWEPCEGQVLPSPETCDDQHLDEDCDGYQGEDAEMSKWCTLEASPPSCIGVGCEQPFDLSTAAGVEIDPEGALVLAAGVAQGTLDWTLAACAGIYGAEWCLATWAGETPDGSAIEIEVRDGDVYPDFTGVLDSRVARESSCLEQANCYGPQQMEVRLVLERGPGGQSPRLWNAGVAWACIKCF
jgi:hypothetical protein